MGAQYSTGVLAAEWKGWLEERGSLEAIRASYQDFQRLCAERNTSTNGNGEDGFFVTAQDFRQVFVNVADFPPPKRETGPRVIGEKRARPGDAERGRRLHLDACFSHFDVLGRGRVPAGVVWAGLALMTGAGELGKIKFVLGMYDADRDGKVNQTELSMAMNACATGFCRLHGIKPPSDATLKSLAKEAFLHQAAMEAEKAAREAAQQKNVDNNGSIITASAVTTTTTTTTIGGSDLRTLAKSLPAEAVSTYCRTNSRCRNFLKGVGSSGSADLVILYKQEHELLRDLAEIDKALDDHEQRAKALSSARKAYAFERGGDVRRLVIHGARVRALAEKWGMGRLLKPTAIRVLLAKMTGEKRTPEPRSRNPGLLSAERKGQTDIARSPSHATRKVSWMGSAFETHTGNGQVDTGGGNTGGGRGNGGSDSVAKQGLGLREEGNDASPDLHMQVLMEVARLVRAAAIAGGPREAQSGNAAAMATAAASSALKAQKSRRVARQAEIERGIRERAHEAAASLGTGEWKSILAQDSVAFARNYKIGIAKKANQTASGGGGNGSMKLVGLSRGGEESSSVHGGELRNVRDWEILKDEQVLAVEGSALTVGNKNGRSRASSERWSAPFAIRLDIDTLEDLVEGAGSFITDKEAKEALAPGGDLERDQLGRVTLVGYLRWSRLRERKRLEAEARLRHPPSPWRQKLACWRQAWGEIVIKEAYRARKALNHRPPNHDENPAGGGDSTVASTDGSGHSRNLSSGIWGTNASGTSSSLFSNGKTRTRTKCDKTMPEERLSRVAISLVIPKAIRHGKIAAIACDGTSQNRKHRNHRRSTAAPAALNNADGNTPIALGKNTTDSKTRHYQSAPVGATLRLDIVRADRDAVGEEARVIDNSDSAAREILKWYSDEQTKKKEIYWEEQGKARKEREARGKSEGLSTRKIREVEVIEGRKAAAAAPIDKTMGAVLWFDMPFLPSSPATALVPPEPTREWKLKRKAEVPATSSHGLSSSSSTANSSVDDGSLSRKLAAEKESATEADAVQAKTAERVENEFRSFFNCIPRDYRDELGFTDILVAVVNIRFRQSPPNRATSAPTTATGKNPNKRAGLTPSSDTGFTATNSLGARGTRRVLRLAFFWEDDPLQITVAPVDRANESKAQPEIAYHPLAEIVVKFAVQVELSSGLMDILGFMKPWKNFRRRLYGPQEEELPKEALDPREYARRVLEEIQDTAATLRQVSSMGFESLRPILHEFGLSEVGTLGELSARVTSALEGKIKATAEGGGLSKFGENAVRMIFGAADKDNDGGLSYTEMVGMLRRMGLRALPRSMATELDYLRTLKEIGVKTDRNGFVTEDGLIAFYREYGKLGNDVEAAGVASLDSLLGVKVSAVGEVDASAAARLENMLLEKHSRLERYRKALSFMLRFARDVHLDCTAESLADWLAPASEDSWVKGWLLQPGWVARAVERVQQWLADGDEGVIPMFRSAAAMALGENWAARPGARESVASNAHQDDANADDTSLASRLHHHCRTAAGTEDCPSTRASSRVGDTPSITTSAFAPASEPCSATCPHDGENLKSPDSCQPYFESLPNDTIPIPKKPILAEDTLESREAPDIGEPNMGNNVDAAIKNRSTAPEEEVDEVSVVNEKLAPNIQIRRGELRRSRVDDIGSIPADGAGLSETNDNTNGNAKRSSTAEGNLDLAEYLCARDGDGGGGDDISGLGGLDVEIPEGDEENGRNTEEEEEEEPELKGTAVEAGSVKDMEAAVAKTKRLRNMLKCDLPSKVAEDLRQELEAAEETASSIHQRLEMATSTAITRGLRAYDTARMHLEEIATVGVGTQKVTARLQVTGFPFFSLLPAGMGEPDSERFEEESRDTRAEYRRRVALEEIDRAKAQQVWEREERERKRTEAKRLREEERMIEEIDLYERGLSARQMSATRESEKAQAEQHWRRLVALRQRRRKGTPAAAVAVNNLGVLLVEQLGHDSAQAKEGRRLLRAAVTMAWAGVKDSATGTESSSANCVPPPSTTQQPNQQEDSHRWAKKTENTGNNYINSSSSNSRRRGDTESPPITTTVTSTRAPKTEGPEGGYIPASGVASMAGGGTCIGESELWAGPLALFSSNLSFALEGPGRCSDFAGDADGTEDEEGSEREGEESNWKDIGSSYLDGTSDGQAVGQRCENLFKVLSPAALSIAAGPAGSWVCSGVGVALFKENDGDPFWWRREHPEDKERRREEAKHAGHVVEQADNGVHGTRRGGISKQRRQRPSQKGEGRLTDLEVLEVIDPPRAARIRIRMARQKSQKKRRLVLIQRRKECEAELREEEEKAEKARVLAREASRANRVAAYAARRLRKEAKARADARAATGGSRLVRAAVAVKAVRARTLAGSNWTMQFAKTVADRIRVANRGGDNEELQKPENAGGNPVGHTTGERGANTEARPAGGREDPAAGRGRGAAAAMREARNISRARAKKSSKSPDVKNK